MKQSRALRGRNPARDNQVDGAADACGPCHSAGAAVFSSGRLSSCLQNPNNHRRRSRPARVQGRRGPRCRPAPFSLLLALRGPAFGCGPILVGRLFASRLGRLSCYRNVSRRLSSTWSIQSGEGWRGVFPNLQKGANLFSLKGGHGRRLPLDAVHHAIHEACPSQWMIRSPPRPFIAYSFLALIVLALIVLALIVLALIVLALTFPGSLRRQRYAASFRPSFSGVVLPVWIRHRSTARQRANATIAFFLPDRCPADSTAFQRCSGTYPG